VQTLENIVQEEENYDLINTRIQSSKSNITNDNIVEETKSVIISEYQEEIKEGFKFFDTVSMNRLTSLRILKEAKH